MRTLVSTDRRLAWAAAALAFAVGALASPHAAGASSIEGHWHIADPIIGPWEQPRHAHEPKSRWQKPAPAGLDSLSFPHFTGPEFNELFTTAELPNLSSVSAAPTITDSAEMDEGIRTQAIERGYQRRPLPADYALMRLIDDGLALQHPAAKAWLALARDAAAHDIELRLVSAYRGHRYQRQVFLRPLETPYELDDFAERMKHSAPPGYSKHHTGYAVDIGHEGFSDSKFGESPAYEWLAADNFANAKKHGWIPSYPPDGGRQGPVPEPWEFTYVGVKAILCFHQPPTGDDPLCTA
ncbi:M15 family metallopeptidase [Candidatus Poriferisodalis sp.]|uniref:M15 family metallopeptidase n=1 Tax=Candidatus Poriferisodalis sp. TaxID=3101277 RepID=UPI003B0297F0